VTHPAKSVVDPGQPHKLVNHNELGTAAHGDMEQLGIQKGRVVEAIEVRVALRESKAYRVGVPAKSGVSGGVLAIVNRQMAIAGYSPRLDARGNSCRGIDVCTELAATFGLHAFDCLNVGSSFVQSVL